MNLDANMVRHEANDAFGIRRGDAAASVLKAARQPIDPEPTVRVQHHLDDAGIFEIPRDRGPSAVRSMRAPRAKASDRKEIVATSAPLRRPGSEADVSAGLIRKSRNRDEATRLNEA